MCIRDSTQDDGCDHFIKQLRLLHIEIIADDTVVLANHKDLKRAYNTLKNICTVIMRC